MSTKTLPQVQDFQTQVTKIYEEKLSSVVNQTMDIAIEEGFEIFIIIMKADKNTEVNYIFPNMEGPAGTDVSYHFRVIKDCLKGLIGTSLKELFPWRRRWN